MDSPYWNADPLPGSSDSVWRPCDKLKDTVWDFTITMGSALRPSIPDYQGPIKTIKNNVNFRNTSGTFCYFPISTILSSWTLLHKRLESQFLETFGKTPP